MHFCVIISPAQSHDLYTLSSVWSQLHTEQISFSQLWELHSLHPAQPKLDGDRQSINQQQSQKKLNWDFTFVMNYLLVKATSI